MLATPRKILKELPLEESLELICNSIDNIEAHHFKVRFENLEKDNRLGLLMHEVYWTELNKIRYSWLKQIEYFTDDEIAQIEKNSFLKLKPDEILVKLKAASFRLDEWTGDFKNLPDSHINRNETSEIVAWIDSTLKEDEKGVVLLVGDAGTGKSVILRDVMRELESRKTPVLGIKADQYCAETIESLESKLHLKEGIESIAKSLSFDNERVVILIDQIDALSQSLSVKREYSGTFNHLVRLLLHIPAVRIVISCRTYDLQNDHDFSFYSQQKKIIVGRLTEEQVNFTLSKLSVDAKKLPLDLLNLLQTPLHLDIFCRVYNPGLVIEKIKVLRDLYDELWLQKVDNPNSTIELKVSPEKISTLLFELALTMYQRQGLAIPEAIFRSRFFAELTYLKSADIILQSSDGLTFFHQTFYDYVFAKQFVESGVPIEEYLLNNGQNLHIRSCLKMMIEFLRERNPKEYLRVVRLILTSSEFYFHIKSLVLSLLGFVKNPKEDEMKLAREIIFAEPLFLKAFIASVKSQKWFLFLLSEKQPQKLIEPFSEVEDNESEKQKRFNKVNIVDGLLLRHLPENRNDVLAFLFDLPEFELKYWLIQSALRQIESWDNPLAFKLFDAYSFQFYEGNNADFLKKASKYDFGWAFEHLKKAIEKTVETKDSAFGDVEFEHSLEELIKFFIAEYPASTFDLLLDFQLKRSFPEWYKRKKINRNKIQGDFPLLSIEIDEDRHTKGLFILLISCVRILAKNQSPRFDNFVSESLASQSATKLLIIAEGFRANVLAYNESIFEFFRVFFKKRGVDACSWLSSRTQLLLKESIPYFSETQKNEVIHWVSQLESESEDEWIKRESKPEWAGHTRFQWLKFLKENDVILTPTVKQSFEELSYKFPESPKVTTERYDFQNMSLEEWKTSFETINDSESGEKPDLNKRKFEDLAWKFEDQVKKRPDFFLPLIEELPSKASCPSTFFIYGLCGLKEAKVDTLKLLSLFKKIDSSFKGLENWEITRLVHFCAIFINEKLEDDFVVNFLVNLVMKHTDPSDETLKSSIKNASPDSLLAPGFKTVRGSATHYLPGFYYFKKHENLLFEALEHVAEQDFLAVRCQMMPRLALLTTLDKERSLRLFLQLTKDGEAAIMEHTPWSVQYLARQNFEGMKPFFMKALSHPKLYKNMATILAMTWAFEREDALFLLDCFIAMGEEAKAGAISAAAHNILNDKGKPVSRSIELFERFLGDKSDEVVEAYDMAFRHLKPADFPHLQPTLLRFAHTVIARKNPRPFYEFLLECATAYPEACLELVENFADYEKLSIRSNGYYDNEPIKVVINAYNVLWGRNIKDHEMLKKALLIFDKMLQDDRFRTHAENVLMEVMW